MGKKNHFAGNGSATALLGGCGSSSTISSVLANQPSESRVVEESAPAPKSFKLAGLAEVLDVERMREAIERKKQEAENLAIQIRVAKDLAMKMVKSFGEVEHFFVAGNEEEIKAASDQEAVKTLRQNLSEGLKRLMFDGSIEPEEGGWTVGKAKLHCVIPARLVALSGLVELTKPREANQIWSSLRGLTREEVVDIAKSVDILVSNPTKNLPSLFMRNGTEWTIGTNLQPHEVDEFSSIINQLNEAERLRLVDQDFKAKEAMKMVPLVASLDEAIQRSTDERGALYLAGIPAEDTLIKGERVHLPGGVALLYFHGDFITLCSNGALPVAQGDNKFTGFVQGLANHEARITIQDVVNMRKGFQEPGTKLPNPDFKLWHLIRRHIAFLPQHGRDMGSIEMMCQQQGQVMVLDTFFCRQENETLMISPAAMRVEYAEVEGKMTIRVLEVSPSLNPFVGHLSDDKVFVVADLRGVLAEFIRQWKEQQATR